MFQNLLFFIKLISFVKLLVISMHPVMPIPFFRLRLSFRHLDSTVSFGVITPL